MGWLVFAAVLLFMLGSISWLRPSAGDQRRMRLRQRGIELGMRVSLQRLEVPGEEARMLAVYLLRRQKQGRAAEAQEPWMLVRSDRAMLAPAEHSGWCWQRQPRQEPATLTQVLTALPVGVCAVAAGREGVQFWWTEELDDPAAVDRLAAAGEKLLAAD